MTHAKRSKSSQRWLQEHFSDEFVKRAHQEGWRSRAVFKLEEIQLKERLIRPGMTVIDLGAAPGGWSQYVRRVMGERGRVIALDILPIEPMPGVDILQGDFREQPVLEQLYAMLQHTPVDLILSDMAPNFSGNKAIDQPGAMYLAELAFDMAQSVLAARGALLIKTFQGEGFEALCRQLRGRFQRVVIKKPKASRARSNEMYLLAQDFRP